MDAKFVMLATAITLMLPALPAQAREEASRTSRSASTAASTTAATTAATAATDKPQTVTLPANALKTKEASASPLVSKAKVREIEHEKEKVETPLKDSASDRTMMLLRNSFAH